MADEFNRICKDALENGGAIVGKHMCSASSSRLNYSQCTRMILDIGSQLESLRENGLGLLYLTTDDITITSDGSYLLTPLEDPLLCDETGLVLIDRPFTYNETTMAPELNHINTLPAKVYYTCVYYSLKHIVLHMLGIDSIRKLYPTKLFYLIERCSVIEPKERFFIFV